jgi:predicted DNA-binding protein YlxM (UPF0122 family)
VMSEQANSSELCPRHRRPDALSISEVASLFGLSEDAVLDLVDRRRPPVRQDFFSVGELARRWRCSRGSVYNRLRAAGAKVLDFAPPGKRGKKAVSASTVLQIESRHTRRLC